MGILDLVYKNLTKNKPRTLLTILAVALAVLVLSSLILITTALSEDIITQSESSDLIVGGQGSPTQLLLSTKFHYELPPGNIPYQVFQELKEDERVTKAVPLALGDNYQGRRIIGTDYTYFVAEEADISNLLADGRFSKEAGEAVIGAEVAKRLDLELGSEFKGEHGIEAGGHGHQHNFTYRVVGILKPGLGSDDNVIFTNLESVWQAHHISGQHFDFFDERLIDSNEHEDEHHGHDYLSGGLELTAILVEASDVVGLNQLRNELNSNWDVQAIISSEVARNLLDLIGDATNIINTLVAIILILALVAIIIALLSLTLERQEEIAIMRLLGSSKKQILLMVFLEGVIIILAGILFGAIASYVLSYWISLELEALAGLSLDLLAVLPKQLLSLALVLLLGAVIALIPALKSYYNEAIKHIN